MVVVVLEVLAGTVDVVLVLVLLVLVAGAGIDHRHQPKLTHATQPAKCRGIDDSLHTRGDGYVHLWANTKRRGSWS